MRSLCCLFAFCAFVVAGCNSDVTRVAVKGKVTLDGKSVEKGLVSFVPADGKSPTGKGGEIVDGHYSAQVVPGDVIVKISSPKVVGKKKRYDTPDSPVDDVTEEAIPKKYNEESTLKEKIDANRKEIDFALTTK
jgi:hypothetical protein